VCECVCVSECECVCTSFLSLRREGEAVGGLASLPQKNILCLSVPYGMH
jgi:hypothetical protein